MLIENYTLEIFTPPCHPSAVRYTARARLSVDISEILPFLNATLPGAQYRSQAGALIWKKSEHHVAFHACEILVSNVEDRTEAQQELENVIRMVNDTWERRRDIQPDHSERKRPTSMAIYKLLPNTNCRACSEPTCYSFALKLTAGKVKLQDCPVVQEPQYARNLAELEELLPG
jgi:ArsR family metal-binding transcriptional regulator